MENHNTCLAPGFTLNDIVLAPANVVVLPGPLAPCLWGPTQPLPGVLPAGEPPLPCGPKTPGLHSAPGDSPFPPEHRQVWSCGISASALPLFTVLMEFKPSPLSFLLFAFLIQSLWLFPLFHFLSSCFVGSDFHIFSPLHLCPFYAHKSGSLPSATSLSPS